MPSLALCAIVRNEAENIARMLQSVVGLVDTMVLLDTGSTDETIAIARSFGATVHEAVWPGSFAEARNQAMALCDADWILSLDGDEALEVSHHDEVRRQVANPDRHVVMIELVNYLSGNHTSRFHYPRLYRRDPAIHYAGKVHNQLIYPYAASYAPILIHHWGYLRTGEARLIRLQQTLALCQQAVIDAPTDPDALYYLAQTQFQLGDYTAAVANSERVLSLLPDGIPPPGSMLRETYFKLAYYWFLSADPEKAIDWVQRGLARGGNQVDLHFLGGRIHRLRQSQPEAAIAHWQGFLAAKSAQAHGDTRDLGQSTYFNTHEADQEAWRSLAAAYAQLGQPMATAAVLAEWAALMPEDPEPVAQQVWLDLSCDRPQMAEQRLRALPATMPRSDLLEAGGMVAALRTRGPAVEAAVRSLVDRPPLRWTLREHFAKWLVSQDRQADADAVLTAWQRWLPGDRRVAALRETLELPGGHPAVAPDVTAALTHLRQPGLNGATAMSVIEAIGQRAAASGDRALALWAAGEAWALQPDSVAHRTRYLGLRPQAPDRGGRRLQVTETPSPDAAAALMTRIAKLGATPVPWHRPLAAHEVTLVIGPLPPAETQAWVRLLQPLGLPSAVAMDLTRATGADLAAAGTAVVPTLSSSLVPNPGDGLPATLARWRAAAADAFATLAAAGHVGTLIPLLLDRDGHCDVAAAVLQEMGAAGAAHPMDPAMEAGFWRPYRSTATVADSPWAWTFPAGGMWLRRPPMVACGPAPVPESLLLAGHACPITVVAEGWVAVLPVLGPGYYEVTAHVAGQAVSWWFGWSTWA